MKAIRSPFHHLNLVIDPFQPTGMDGKSTMVENAIGIPFQHFGKSHHWTDFAFKSHRTPIIQCFLSPFRIQIIPEFLQRILENVYRGQVLIQLKQSFESWFFVGKQMIFILQKQIKYFYSSRQKSKNGLICILDIASPLVGWFYCYKYFTQKNKRCPFLFKFSISDLGIEPNFF